MVTNTMEDVLSFPKPQQERRLRPQPDQALKCPRCDSLNTKFCYYNNYSLSQPRYFCKGCRRYWTQGGTLRNVPVGGGCRKNKRSSSSSSSSSSTTSTSKRSQEQALVITTNSNNLNIPNFTTLGTTYDSNDLTLAFARLHNHHQPRKQFGLEDHDHHDTNSILGSLNSSHCDILASPNNPTTNMSTAPFIDALRSGLLETQNSGFQNFGYGSFGRNEEVGDQMEGVVLPNYNEVLMRSGTTTASTVTTTTKQEYLSCKSRNINGENINRGFWNFPWHNIGTGGGSGGVGVDFGDHQGSSSGGVENTGRESWNGIGPSWHGLINSPLM